MRRVAWGLLLAGAAIACGDGGGPQPGQLTVTLATQNQARAIVFRVTGPNVQAVTGLPTGSFVYQVVSVQAGPDTVRVAVFAPQGATLQPGVIAAFDVPDVGAAASYTATVEQVAGPGYALQTPFQFVLAIARP